MDFLSLDDPRCKHTGYFTEKLTLRVTANLQNKKNGNPVASPEEFSRLKPVFIFIPKFYVPNSNSHTPGGFLLPK